MDFDADDQATITDDDQLSWPYRWLAYWIVFLLGAIAVAALGFVTFGVVLVFRYLIGLDW